SEDVLIMSVDIGVRMVKNIVLDAPVQVVSTHCTHYYTKYPVEFRIVGIGIVIGVVHHTKTNSCNTDTGGDPYKKIQPVRLHTNYYKSERYQEPRNQCGGFKIHAYIAFGALIVVLEILVYALPNGCEKIGL